MPRALGSRLSEYCWVYVSGLRAFLGFKFQGCGALSQAFGVLLVLGLKVSLGCDLGVAGVTVSECLWLKQASGYRKCC